MADASDTKDTFELDGQVEGVKSPSNNSEQSQVDDGYLRSSTEEGFKPLKDDGKVRQSQEFSMAEIQDENLNLHEALRDLEIRCREAEQNAYRRASQVEELQKRLMSMEEDASAARSAATESLRLTDENALLGSQLREMEINLKDLISTQGLGHTNTKQPIQYHLRLKHELEELRSKCASLLKERFHLEQCVRYLVANSKLPRYLESCGKLHRSSATQKPAFQPTSLQAHYLYETPSSRASMAKSSRGIIASANKAVTPSKEELVDAIQLAAARTASSFKELATDVEQHADTAATPIRQRQSSRSGQLDDIESCSQSRSPSEDGERTTALSETPSDSLAGKGTVEKRILAKIAEICTPAKAGGPSSGAQMKASTDSGLMASGGSLQLRKSYCKPTISKLSPRPSLAIWR